MNEEFLGKLTPTHDWEFLPVPLVEKEVIKLEFPTPPFPKGILLLTQAWGEDFNLFGIQKIYPSRLPLLINVNIPESLFIQGFTTRYIGMRLSFYAQLYDYPFDVDIYAIA